MFHLLFLCTIHTLIHQPPHKGHFPLFDLSMDFVTMQVPPFWRNYNPAFRYLQYFLKFEQAQRTTDAVQ